MKPLGMGPTLEPPPPQWSAADAAAALARPVRVACLTGRSILGQGVLAILEMEEGLEVVDRPDHADVTVVLADLGDLAPGLVREQILDPGRTVAVGSIAGALDLVHEGVAGIVTTHVLSEDLRSVVLQVAAGHRAFSPDVADLLVRQISQPVLERGDLTTNQRRVLERLAAGGNITQIAEQLGVSHQAISQTLERLRHRLRVETNRELARYARRRDIVE